MRCATLRAISILALLLPFSAQTASAERSTVPNAIADETASAATITVSPGCGPLLPALGIRGRYWTEDASAKAGEDYEAVSDTFALFEGDGPRTFRIPLIDDRIREGDETVRVKVLLFSNEVWFGVGAAGGCPGHPTWELIEATLTITDDETPRRSAREGS